MTAKEVLEDILAELGDVAHMGVTPDDHRHLCVMLISNRAKVWAFVDSNGGRLTSANANDGSSEGRQEQTRLEPDAVRGVDAELQGVLDGDDPLVVGDEGNEHVEQRRVAARGAAADEDIAAGV